MASQNTTASGTVLFQDSDELSESTLGELLASDDFGDKRHRGLNGSADYVNDELTIGAGMAIIKDSVPKGYLAAPSQTSVPLVNSNGKNYVFLSIDPATDDSLSWHVDDDDTAPSNPSIKTHVVDTSAQTVTEKNTGGSETRVNISDDGASVLTDAEDIDFASNLSVSDDGDGTVTVDATDTNTDTRTNVSDDGSQVVADTDDINFTTNLNVTDDGDGSVSVDASGISDTRTDVSNDGTQVVADTDDINFGTDLAVSDDGDGSVTVDASAGSGLTTKLVDSSSTTSYTTSGEDKIYVDTSSAAVTITLSDSDTTQGNEVEVVHIGGSNAITVDTQSSQTIDPGAESSKAINKAGSQIGFVSDGSNWDSSLAGEFETLSTDKINTSSGYSWQDVSASRTLNTWFTAPSEQDIKVAVSVNAESAGIDLQILPNVNNSQTENRIIDRRHQSPDQNDRIGAVFTVPAGRDYKVETFDSSDISVNKWRELK